MSSLSRISRFSYLHLKSLIRPSPVYATVCAISSSTGKFIVIPCNTSEIKLISLDPQKIIGLVQSKLKNQDRQLEKNQLDFLSATLSGRSQETDRNNDLNMLP